MQYVSSPNMVSQNNKIVVGKKKKWQLKCGWQKEQNSCASLFQEHILKDKKKKTQILSDFFSKLSSFSFSIEIGTFLWSSISDSKAGG